MRRLLAAVLLACGAASARAAAVSWTGGAVGDWSVGANWSGAQAPGPADDATIAGAFVVAYATDAPLSVNSLTLGAGATLNLSTGLAAAGNVLLLDTSALQFGATVPLFAGTFAMLSGSSVAYVGAPFASGPVPPLDLHAGLFTMAAGSTITVSGRGYAGGDASPVAGAGPGAGGAGSAATGGGGGGHGGAGGFGGAVANGGAAYDLQPPADAGSGGGGAPSVLGGAGGGFLTIDAATAALNGLIEADGLDGESIALQGAGGGAGGAVIVRASVLGGTGTITANGGAGGTAPAQGGGAGGGGIIWLRESSAFNVVHATLTLTFAGGLGGSAGGAVGGDGAAGRLFFDPRHWVGGVGAGLASNASNWTNTLAPAGGERLVFGSAGVSRICSWNLPSISIGSATFASSFSSSVVLASSMSVTGTFDLAGGIVASTAGVSLAVGGNLTQTGGVMDLTGSSLTLAAAGLPVSAAFVQAQAGTLLIGASTATLSGPFTSLGLVRVPPAATLTMDAMTLSIGGNGPFTGGGSVNLTTATVLNAAGTSTQTWTVWPSIIGGLQVSNTAAGGLVLSTAAGTYFPLFHGVTVSTGASITAAGARLELQGDWANYGTAALAQSTVAFKAVAGTQTVSAGGYFDTVEVDNNGAVLAFSTWVVAGTSVSLNSGTLDLGNSTFSVRGNWFDNGARVLGSSSVVIFDGILPTTVRQLAPNTFSTFRSSCAGGVVISSIVAATGNFEWHRGNLAYPGAALTIGGDMLVKGGILLNPAGSTVVFNGSSNQTVTFTNFGDFVDANTSPFGLLLGASFINTASFLVRPGSVLNAGGSAVTSAGPFWDTAFSTYNAPSPAHSVLWQPTSSITVSSGSLINGKLALSTGKTAVLQGDLVIGGAGSFFDPRAGSTVVNAPGGSTITFRDSANLTPSSGGNWTYGGDATDSWLVFEGSGTLRGVTTSSNTFGSLRVALNGTGDVFKAPNLNLSRHLVMENGTLRPNGGSTLSLGGDLLQTGGAVDFASIATGTVVMVGPSTQTIRLLPGANTLCHLIDGSTAQVQLASDLTLHGDLVISSGSFLAGSGVVKVRGALDVGANASFSGQSSTVTLDGASIGAAAQSVSIAGTAAFNGLSVNVLTVNFLTSATANAFTDSVAGGTLTVAAGARLTAADLRLGPSGGSRLTVRSSIPGVPWFLEATAFSSATAVAAFDSNATPGLTMIANDGRSLDGGGNSNWNFNPVLLVLLPGESLTPSVAPGKTGAPSPSTAGVPIAATVVAVSSRFERAFTATGTVTLTTDDPFAVLPATAPLAAGSVVMTFTPLTAEPLPRLTHASASVFFGSGLSTTSVVPAGLARLQIILFGETPVPGSATGRIGSPFARVKSVPFAASVRAVDSYWNVVATMTDSYALGTSASSSTLPFPLALSAGVDAPSGLAIYTTGLFTLTATDLTEPFVQSATSAVFGVVPPSVSSPTGAFYVPTGAAITTLSGVIAGTAADSSSIARVRVDLRELETGFHYDSSAQAFSAALPIYTTTTLASPLAASTSWFHPVPDGALVSGRHYAAVALVDDPSGFLTVAASTFAVDRSALSYGSRSGQGTATALPAGASGCAPMVATVTFTVGAAGIGPGGAVAVRVPDGWTPPAGTTASSPPPAGFFRLTSTSTALLPANSTAAVNAAAFGAQPLGAGWLLLSVATNAAASFQPGQNVIFQYAGLPPLSPAGRGAQTFSVWTAADATVPLAPISTQPAVSLSSGAVIALAFTDSSPLNLGPLQSAPTMQMKIVDLCGNDALGASSGTVTLSMVVPVGGGFVTDASAQFRALNGSPITTVALSSGVAFTAGFTVATSTNGPSLSYIRASSSFTASTSSVTVVALRAVRLTASSATFSGVSVDSGTLSPGTTSVALSAAVPDAYSARVAFTLSDPSVAWDAVLSSDFVSFSSPVFRASGYGDASGPVFLSWDGVDRVSSPARYAPPGRYRAQLRAGGGSSVNRSVEIVVSTTAAYAGRFGPGGAGAHVRAVGPGAGEGSFAQASATGYFLLSGLRAGQRYQLTVATASSSGGLPVLLSTAVAGPPAVIPAVDLGTVTLPAPARVRVSAGLPIAAPFDVLGGFVGRAADGSAAFSGALRFSTGAATSDDGGPLFGRAASTWSAVLAQPGVYTLELDVPDLRLSTAIAGVVVGPSGIDVPVQLEKRANARGWAILPVAAPGTTISLQATRAGASAPSAFSAALAASSAPYALYGLDPGSWTVLASAPGFLSTSAAIVVTDTSDVTGVDLTLGAGGAITGAVTVTGDSRAATQCFPGTGGAAAACPAGTFDLEIEAQAAGSLQRATARARVTASATSATGVYAVTGLAPGLWNVRTSLPGFALSPAGGTDVGVAAAATSTSSLTMVPQDARLSVTVNLAPLAGGACRTAASWKSLGLTLDAADGASRVFADATALTGAGSFKALNCSSATFFSPALPPGPVRAAAAFATTGAWAYGRALLSDGATAALTLDLTASSTTASGLLSVSGLISVATRTAAGVPFTVAATSAAGVLNGAANVSFCLLGSADPASAQSLRAELVPYDPASGSPASVPPLRRATGGAGSCAAPAASTAAVTSLGFVALVNTDGSFRFNPGVAPGTYVLRVPGELDEVGADGAEALQSLELVTIGPGGAVLTPRLGRGSRVSGSLSAPASVPAGRLFHVALIGADGREARGLDAGAAPGGAAAFSLDGVGDGRYALTVTDLASPRAFAAPPLTVAVNGADVTGLAPALSAAGTVRARLAVTRLLADGTREAVLITRDNAFLLAPGFAATAAPDPELAGGSLSSRLAPDGGMVDAEGRLTVDGVPPGTYDVSFAAPAGAALGSGALALAPATVSGVLIQAGQAVDLGVVTLFSGSFVSGRVTDEGNGTPVPGLRVAARPSDAAGASPGADSASLSAVTDASGRYVLRGLDPARRWYDVTAAPRGQVLSGAALAPYASKRALAVDVSSGAVQDFALRPARGSVTGAVAAAGGGSLSSTLGPGDAALPGAAITLQAGGVNPSDDPLADLSLRSAPDGTFVIPAVASGTYRLTATALGRGTAVRSIVVGTAAVSAGTLTLGSGGTLSGAVRFPDGSAPSAEEVQAIAAATPDSTEFLYAALSLDPAGRAVVGYQVGGLTPGRAYRLVVAGPGGSAYAPPEGAAVVLASTSDARIMDLTLRPPSGPVSFRARRSGARWAVTAQFSRPVRARFAADSDPAVLLSTASAAGSLSGGALSADRRSVTADYAPGLGETSAVFRASATLAATDWSSADPASRELIAGATAALALTGDALTRAPAVNGLGATYTFDGDAGRLVLPRGAFNVDAASAVTVSFARSAAGSAFAAGAPPAALAGPFYDIALGGGAPSALRRPAELTLSYSTAVADPSRLHVYWYNPAAASYVLQPDALGAAPVIDPVARTFTVRVNHFSTYVLLNSAAGVIGGSPFAGGDLDAYNFPNPFDLSVKTVTTIHGGGSPSVRGTLVRVSVPPGLGGGGVLRVFEITGRLIRSIDLGRLSPGQVYYQGWDGRTDAGVDVASGLYLGQVEVAGRRKTFKMAVLK